MNSFIVALWAMIFDGLSKISVFFVVRKAFPKIITVRFVDYWVLSHVLLAFLCVVLASYFPYRAAAYAAMLYGMIRVFEVAVYQMNVLLFDEYRAVKVGKNYEIDGYRRMVLLLLHNYVEIILWLACTYAVLADEFDFKWKQGRETALGSIYSSFITMTTFGDFDLAPKNNLAAVILLFHATVGLFMTLLSLARFISLIPAPKSRDVFEQQIKIEPKYIQRPGKTKITAKRTK